MKSLKKFLPFLIVGIIAISLRTYRINDTVLFANDQAYDLLVAKTMIEDDYRPTTGPGLSVLGLTTPPAYYYLLTIGLAIGKTIAGTTYFFTFINLLAIIGVYLLGATAFSRKIGLTSALIFSISYPLINAGRTMWQPYPQLLFITFSLYFLVNASQKKSIALAFLSSSMYAFASAIYASSVLLLPFFFYHLFLIAKTMMSTPRAIIVTFFLTSAPLITLFASSANNIQLTANNESQFSRIAFPSSTGEFATNIWTNFHTLLRVFFLPNSNSVSPLITLLVASMILLIVARYKKGLIGTMLSNASFIAIGIGFLLLTLFQTQILAYRLLSLFPLMIVVMSYIMNIKSPSVAAKIGIIFLISIFIYGNGTAYYAYVTESSKPDSRREAVQTISSDMIKKNMTPGDATILIDGPDRVNKTTLDPIIYPYIYFLTEFKAPIGTLEFLPNDFNQIVWPNISDQINTIYTYLICERYASASNNPCLARFTSVNSHYQLSSTQSFHSPLTHLYFFTRKTSSSGGIN